VLAGCAVVGLLLPAASAWADQEVTTFAAGSEPVQLAVSPDGEAVYVVNSDSSSMTRYDVVTGATTTITVGSKPDAVVVSPDGSTVAVANYGNNNVKLFTNSATPTLTTTIGVDSEPDGLAFGPGGADLYVSAYGANKLDVVSMASRTVVHSYPVGTSPAGVAISPNGVWAVVATEGGVVDQITLADGAVDAGTINGTPVGVAISPDSRYAYVTQQGYNQVRALDLHAHGWLAQAAAVGVMPADVAVSPDGGLLYVADNGSSGPSGDIAVVDAGSLQRIRTVAADGQYPNGLAMAPDGTRYYATMRGSNTTEIFRAQPWGPSPVISGIARVGAKLTVTAGTWAPVAAALDYQWYANGVPVGTDAATLTIPLSAIGKTITVSVAGSVPGEQVYTSSSTATHAVTKGVFTHPKPRITGAAKVGHKLTAHPGTWSPKATLHYRWFIGGKVVKGATHRTWKVSRKARHRKVTVRVTGHRAGYATSTAVSRPTRKVR
jgi:YVTN family beta-propeller protein